ncbi:hypothetical protein [Nocardioides nanhaiensis]
MTAPTQTAYPWRATVRTVFAAVVGIAAVWGLVIEAAGVDPSLPVVATSIAVAGAITRVLALPGVDDLLARLVPWLATEPPSDEDPAYEYDADDVADGHEHGTAVV